MPLFRGVGKTIAGQLLKLGYEQPNGRPDVRRFCREKGYDDTLFYFWLRDLNTPVKERARLAADLGITESELLFGVDPKDRPGMARRGRKLKSLLLALAVGAGGILAPPSDRDSAHPHTLALASQIDTLRLLGSWRRFRTGFRILSRWRRVCVMTRHDSAHRPSYMFPRLRLPVATA